MDPPEYTPRRAPTATKLALYEAFVRERLEAHPDLSAQRLFQDLAPLGYSGAYDAVKRFVAKARPRPLPAYEVRFETAPGEQAQCDFAEFRVGFTDEPGIRRRINLFSFVLGHSRAFWGRFVEHQDLHTVLRCHVAAFEALGGVPREILYDRMKTAVTDERDEGHIVYNRRLLALAQHYGWQPRACRAYRAKTKGKVERPHRYIRDNFWKGRSFRNFEDLNTQFRDWLDTVANARVHGTTQRYVAEALAEEQPFLQPMPGSRFGPLVIMRRRVSNDGMISVNGNFYSVPDGTPRVVEAHMLTDVLDIFGPGGLVARHPLLPGRNQRSLDKTHRRRAALIALPRPIQGDIVIGRAGDHVMPRSLGIYAAIGTQLAERGAL
jgi:transposase